MSYKSNPGAFEKDLEALINKHSVEGASNTPDFMLANFLHRCLEAGNALIRARDSWYGIEPRPGWRGPSEPPTVKVTEKDEADLAKVFDSLRPMECGRILPTNVRCGLAIPCPHHGKEFAEPAAVGQEGPVHPDEIRRDALNEALESLVGIEPPAGSNHTKTVFEGAIATARIRIENVRDRATPGKPGVGEGTRRYQDAERETTARLARLQGQIDALQWVSDNADSGRFTLNVMRDRKTRLEAELKAADPHGAFRASGALARAVKSLAPPLGDTGFTTPRGVAPAVEGQVNCTSTFRELGKTLIHECTLPHGHEGNHVHNAFTWNDEIDLQRRGC